MNYDDHTRLIALNIFEMISVTVILIWIQFCVL